MNNTTTTETLPKTGHVNEVCKEWLVREDGALAYKLQSQEINDFYKGNRQRNAVVREDFPTALHEQIKEQETAQKQAESYRRRLIEQEEYDKRVAKEIADKLERDIQEQQQRELLESEEIALKMQEIYVNMPPVPPPAARDKSKPPPRPAKASTMQQNTALIEQQPTTSNATRHHRHNLTQQQYQNTHHTNQIPQKLQQQLKQQQQLQYFADTNGYVGLSVNLPANPQRQKLNTSSSHLMKLSPEKYDHMVGNQDNIREQGIQEHDDDIEIYVDPCDYESLKEIGLPLEEIKEISKKLEQEQKDAVLAKRLQEMETNDGLSQEERDRMLAIEAQDKELARMLQEREKAKVKRAKEKARMRKSQQHQKDTSCVPSNGLHCGPLLPIPQDCLSTSKQRVSVTSSPPYISAPRYQPQHIEDPIDMEAYSNPIDVINSSNQQRQPNGTLTNGSLTRDLSRHSNSISAVNHNQNRDDDIYTLPVDSCRPTTNQRPASLIIGSETVTGQHNSMTRSENYSLDSRDSLNGHHEISPRMNFSKSAALDQNSSPTPPYMPIQGTRRSNSGEERKKKSKDKCTHQ